MIGSTFRFEICWTDRGLYSSIIIISLQVSCLSDVHNRFYEFSKLIIFNELTTLLGYIHTFKLLNHIQIILVNQLVTCYAGIMPDALRYLL